MSDEKKPVQHSTTYQDKLRWKLSEAIAKHVYPHTSPDPNAIFGTPDEVVLDMKGWLSEDLLLAACYVAVVGSGLSLKEVLYEGERAAQRRGIV